MTNYLRPSRALFRFTGPDAQKLLFDVVTGRLIAEDGPAVWWALLSPQGKIQAEGLSAWHDDAFWLDVNADMADDFLKRMKLYRLRAKVDIDDLRGSHVVGWSDDAAAGDADPRGIGSRLVAETGVDWQENEAPYVAARVARGVVELGPDFAANELFPHDAGMDLQHGIDFKKGCYIGQEVVSRMEHRGTARRRPVIVSGIPEGAAAGAPILAGEREAGTIGYAVAGEAVGIVRLDRITADAAPTVGGIPVELRLPGWATYRFGESASDG